MSTVSNLYDPTALYAGDKFPAHRAITVAQGAALVRGTVLGRVTATDKYIVSVRTASDGSQNPVAVLAADLDASAADARGRPTSRASSPWRSLTYDASWTATQLQAAFRTGNVPIYARSVGVLG